jgi:hypothetical protein
MWRKLFTLGVVFCILFLSAPIGIEPVEAVTSSQFPQISPPFQIWDDAGQNNNPAVAYNPLHDEYLVVWATTQEKNPMGTNFPVDERANFESTPDLACEFYGGCLLALSHNPVQYPAGDKEISGRLISTILNYIPLTMKSAKIFLWGLVVFSSFMGIHRSSCVVGFGMSGKQDRGTGSLSHIDLEAVSSCTRKPYARMQNTLLKRCLCDSPDQSTTCADEWRHDHWWLIPAWCNASSCQLLHHHC